METTTKPLEQMVSKADWKQWLPAYGIIQSIYDSRKGKPTIYDRDNIVYFAGVMTQSISIAGLAAAAYFAYDIAEKLF